MRQCRHCSRSFRPTRPKMVYCSRRCGWLYRGAIKGVPWRSGFCVSCGAPYQTKQPAQRYCGRVCHERERRIRRGANVRRRVQKPVRQRVLRRDDWTCYLCRSAIDPSLVWPHPRSGTVDHVIPVSAGGSDDPSNLRATHWHCNEEKGDRLLGIEMGFTLEAA